MHIQEESIDRNPLTRFVSESEMGCTFECHFENSSGSKFSQTGVHRPGVEIHFYKFIVLDMLIMGK